MIAKDIIKEMMRKIIYKVSPPLFALVLAFVLMSSCERDARLILPPVPSKESLNIQTEKAYLSIDSLGLVTYPSDPIVYEQASEFFLYVYNYPLHSLDILNVSSRKISDRIYLGDEGPDRIDKIYNLHVHNPDSIYIMSGGKLFLINGEGKVLKNYNTMFEASSITNGGYFHAANEAYFTVDKRAEKLYGFFVHYDVRASERDVAALENNILGSFDLSNQTLSLLPVSYSDFIRENEGDFSELKPNFSFIDGKLYYGFPIESNIYVYDFETGEISSHGAQSAFSANSAKRRSQNQGYDYRTEGTWFNRLNKYPGKTYFYRTHWGSQEKQQANGTPADATSKPGYIMFFDDELRLIHEQRIADDCYLEGSFATDEGVFFWAKDGQDESQVKLCRYYVE